jgi:hypothetical protein|tara:strand:- start:1834 stop:2130 length:297 start_codon:yes stop_codon:yes gene_type:complete
MTHKVAIYDVDGSSTTRDANAEEIAYMKNLKDGKFDRSLDNLRVQRNILLTETDWWGASDNTMTDAQKKYRQDLRDLTTGLDTVEKINSVTWPTKPGA